MPTDRAILAPRGQRSWLQAVGCVAALLVPAVTLAATATVSFQGNTMTGPPNTGSVSTADTATLSHAWLEIDGFSSWSYQASATASLAQGSLRAAARGVTTQFPFGGVTAQAELSDTVTFHAPSSGGLLDIAITLAVQGAFHSVSGLSGFSARGTILFDDSAAQGALFCCSASGTSFLGHVFGEVSLVSNDRANSIAWITVRQRVSPNVALPLTAMLDLSLSASANDIAQANFAHTAQLSIALPEGVSFSSGSGLLLQEPAVPVPEPAAALLMAAGLAAITLRRRLGAAALR